MDRSGHRGFTMKLWFIDNNIEMYSAHNEVKSVVAKRFIKTLNSKI